MECPSGSTKLRQSLALRPLVSEGAVMGRMIGFREYRQRIQEGTPTKPWLRQAPRTGLEECQQLRFGRSFMCCDDLLKPLPPETIFFLKIGGN